MRKLLFFPDTNLFIQCKPLEELDWSVWGEYDEILLVISRPVQAEIDRQKDKGSGRLAKRARTAASLFRKIILSPSEFVVVREKNPAVRVTLGRSMKWDPALSDLLQYEERDDQLVGIAALFAKENSDASVRVLTHDTGPMASARMVGLGFSEIPDHWLLPPETDEMDKRVSALKSELENFKKSEPSFEGRFVNPAPGSTCLEGTVTCYAPLSEEQVGNLLLRLKNQFPEVTEFGSEESVKRPHRGELGMLFTLQLSEKFKPAAQEDIREYRDAYKKWLKDCKVYFRQMHVQQWKDAAWPKLLIELRNTGSRPAEDALITFEVKGDFGILPPPIEVEVDPDDAVSDTQPAAGCLPSPPKAPSGRWENLHDLITWASRDLDSRRLLIPPNFNLRGLDHVAGHDLNGFYWKPNRPTLPVPELSLKCDQWRHQIPAESFELLVQAPLRVGIVTGAIEVQVHAANMTKTFIDQRRVSIEVKYADAVEKANELINQLLRNAPHE